MTSDDRLKLLERFKMQHIKKNLTTTILEVLLEVEQNFGNLEKQPKCCIRPDILPIALGETKNVEQFRFVHQGFNVVRVAHIGQVTM